MKILAMTFALWAIPATAEMTIEQDALIYQAPTSYSANRISEADAIGALLREHPEVKRLVLSGDFLITRDAIDTARVVADFGLDTEVQGECSEGCLYIFVAGKLRTVAPGGQLHLRRIVIPAEVLRGQFERQKKSYGWADEFGQAAFMYDRAQNDMRDALGFLLDHGVMLDFALRVFDTPRQDVWTPTREELIEGGVTLAK